MDAIAPERRDIFDRSASGSEAFAAIVRGALNDARSNLGPARSGDAEGIHQLRIALRRLRTALVLFSPLLPRDPRRELGQRLRQLGRCVGAARDWDVFATETLARAQGSLGPQHHDTLRRRCEERREVALTEAQERLAHADTCELFDRLHAFPALAETAAPVSAGRSLGQPIADLAPRLISRLYSKARHRGRHIRRADDERMHGLRKAIKALRYAVEFTAPLHDQGAAERYLEAARKAQTQLGRANDAHGIPRLADALSADQDTTRTLTDWAHRDHRKTRRKAIRAWKRLRRQGRFWGSGVA